MKQSLTAGTISCFVFLVLILAHSASAQQALHRLAGTGNNITEVSFSKDGNFVLAFTTTGLTILNANTEQVTATIPVQGKFTATLSPDDNTLLIANSGNELEIYSLEQGANARQVSKRKLQTHINTLDFRADGRYYAIGTDDGRIAVMDAQRVTAFATVMEAVPFPGRKAGENYTAVNSLCFTGNDRLMVFAENGEVKAFDVNSGRQVYALEYYHNVIYAPADDAPVQCTIAARSGKLLCSRSGNAFILDLETYNIVGKTAQPGLRSCAIDPSGSVVLACDATHIYMYNGDFSHKHMHQLSLTGITAHPDITKVMISPSLSKVIICSGNELLIADYQSFGQLAGK